MNFKLLTEPISFSTEMSVANLVYTLVSIVKKEVESIILSVLNGTFDYAFSFDRDSIALTKVVGLYMIVNKRSKKVYLGGSVNLAQRRRDYKSYLNKNTKVYKAMREDLLKGQASDFYFVPIVGFRRSSVTGLTNTSEQANSQQLMSFLDFQVEQPLLEEYLSSTCQYASLFYNEKTIGTFTQGNAYGGSPNSGSASKPLMFQNYAWESVSAAANSLLKERKSIRAQRKPNKFREISLEEFNNFVGVKITNANAKDFFKDKPEELQTLKRDLGLR